MKECFFEGNFVPFEKANISIMTHAFNYGTAVFEGIRGYWNPEKKQKFILKLSEHYERLLRSCRVIRIESKYSLRELCDITIDLVRRNNYREDIYIRPLAYKSTKKIGLGLVGVEDDLCIFLSPFGDYLDISKGIRVCTSSWRRLDDMAIPTRAKITGSYINSSLAKSEAIEGGFEEAIMLSHDGHVSEGSGENIFMVRDGKLITPVVTDNILEGITRGCIIQLAKDKLGIDVIERSVDRSELYIADELFFVGTGAQVSPIIEVDRRVVGNGQMGPMTSKLQKAYFAAARGDDHTYKDWITPVY
ncbi:MAG: branched-chain amino acid transaminase [Candidatus Saganbacteria bacterium]|nr:branched-chain amino acid transaminase [Candidatus Saganbacteria bacterium]